ncbi:MAG: amino acid ABC transporter substrate-binding protein [Flavobacteriales bacterium]|nr:amino acid ABC transporter substrate-binding protein [Flavobacteriales bacterium]
MKRKSNLFMISILMLGLTSLMFSCAPSEKKSVLDEIVKSGELTIATSGNQFPFIFKDKEGKLKGIDVIIGNTIAEKMGVKAKFVITDLSDIVAAVKSGKADIAISGLSVTTKRNMEVMFTKPYFVTGKGILSNKKGIQQGKEGAKDEDKITIAVVDNSSSLEYALKHYPHVHLLKTHNLVDSREALYSGKVDGLLADYEICQSFSLDSRNTGTYDFIRIGSADDREFISVAVAPGDALLFNLINNMMQKVRKGKVDDMVEQSWMQYLN